MTRLRWWFLAFFGWLFAFYNIERLHEPFNLASFVYVFASVGAVLVIAFPLLRAIPLPLLLAIPLPVVVLLKAALGYRVGGSALPLTVTEMVAVLATLFFAARISGCLEEFREAVNSTMINHFHSRSRPFAHGQAEIYREIRRARLHHRPLAMLAVSPSASSLQANLQPLIEQVQRESVNKYLTARLAEFLSHEMSDCDIITHNDKHFVTLLPETSREKAQEFIQHLETEARRKLGIDLQIGLSVFPEDEITFVQMLERAEADMYYHPQGQQTNSQNSRSSEPTNCAAVDPHEQDATASSNGQGQQDSQHTTKIGLPTHGPVDG